MSFTTLQNTPLEIYVPLLARTTGWTLSGGKAYHETCNAGKLVAKTYLVDLDGTYQLAVRVESIDTGYVQAFLGNQGSPQITTAGYYTYTVTITSGTPEFYFYSNANCVLSEFTIKKIAPELSNKAQNTIAYNEKINKWTSFYSFAPDCGTALFTDLFTFKDGVAYRHIHNGEQRNNFYGTQYNSYIRFVDNIEPSIVKTFQSLSIQVNQLMITSEDGIQTSLGQISELSQIDFLKDVLDDGVSVVDVFSKEGVYSASYLRDKNVDLLSGEVLKGNYQICELVTTENTILRLFTINIVSKRSAIGVR